MNTSLGWHQLVGASAGAYFHTHLGLCGASAAGRPPAQHCTLNTSSQTWDLPCRLPWECTWQSHHHSALNLSSFPGDNPNKPMNPFITGVFGALAGAASVFGNTPLDVVKTRMQVQCQGLVWDTQCLGAGWGHPVPGTCFMQSLGQAHDACKVWFGRCLGLLLSHGECLHGGGHMPVGSDILHQWREISSSWHTPSSLPPPRKAADATLALASDPAFLSHRGWKHTSTRTPGTVPTRS